MMKTRMLLFFLVLGFIVPQLAAAQAAREQLDQLAARLRANPGDQALRERVITLARETRPAPAIPEEARRHFVEGMAIAKSAQAPAQQSLAVQSFKEALKIVPWWGDAYYNLAISQELAGELDAAQESLKFYMLTNPGEKEVRDAQDRIYTLNAKKRLVAAAQNSPEALAERERGFLRSLEGAVWRGETTYAGGAQRRDYVVRNSRLERVWHWTTGTLGPGSKVESSVQLTGRRVVYNEGTDECNPHAVQISDDALKLTDTVRCHGRTHTFEYHRASP